MKTTKKFQLITIFCLTWVLISSTYAFSTAQAKSQVAKQNSSVNSSIASPEDSYSLNGEIVGDGSLLVEPFASDYPVGTVVTVTAVPADGSNFISWGGACATDDVAVIFGDSKNGVAKCVLTMDNSKNITVTFKLREHSLSTMTTGTGKGTIVHNPINEGNRYSYGTVVTLTAVAQADSIFTGWTGDCSGLDDCILTMNQDHLVSANFLELQPSLSLAASLQNEQSIYPNDFVAIDITLFNDGETTNTINYLNVSFPSLSAASSAQSCVFPVTLEVAASHECSIMVQANGGAGQKIPVEIVANGQSAGGQAISKTTTIVLDLATPAESAGDNGAPVETRIFLPLINR